MGNIKKITARQIFDSRGNPTVEVDVITDNSILGRAAVPSGENFSEVLDDPHLAAHGEGLPRKDSASGPWCLGERAPSAR